MDSPMLRGFVRTMKTPAAPVQDVPPAGGFPMVKYKRNLPKGGASSVVTLGGAVVLFCFGMYKVIEANKLRREWRREQRDVRLAIMPFLQAEADVQRDFLRAKLLEKEADLMKDVPDWEVGASVYKTRHMKPMEQIGVLPSSIFGIPK